MKRILRKQLEKITLSESTSRSLDLKPRLIGYYSIDSNLQYCPDLSQLKYYISPPDPSNVNFDLNVDVMSTCDKSTSHIKLDNILRWISDNFQQLENPKESINWKTQWLSIDFVSSCETLRTILCSSNSKRESIIYACKYRGTIYLYELPNKLNADEKERQQATTSEKQIPLDPHKFEQRMTADHPSHQPNPSVPFNKCEQFHCIFTANSSLNYTILYDAKIDAICSQQPITDILTEQNFELIEFKTLRVPSGTEHSTLDIISKCWGTNYLKRTDKIIVGFSNANNIVRRMEECSINSLLNHSKPACDVTKCKTNFNEVLNSIKKFVTKDYKECVYKFCWNLVKNGLIYLEEDPCDEMHFLLEYWFVDKAEELSRKIRAQKK